MKLEDIIVCEISQSPKDKYSMFPFIQVPKLVKFAGTEIEGLLLGVWGRGKGDF